MFLLTGAAAALPCVPPAAPLLLRAAHLSPHSSPSAPLTSPSALAAPPLSSAGANTAGKSTVLRAAMSVALLANCGYLVPARRASVRRGSFANRFRLSSVARLLAINVA